MATIRGERAGAAGTITEGGDPDRNKQQQRVREKRERGREGEREGGERARGWRESERVKASHAAETGRECGRKLAVPPRDRARSSEIEPRDSTAFPRL